MNSYYLSDSTGARGDGWPHAEKGAGTDGVMQKTWRNPQRGVTAAPRASARPRAHPAAHQTAEHGTQHLHTVADEARSSALRHVPCCAGPIERKTRHDSRLPASRHIQALVASLFLNVHARIVETWPKDLVTPFLPYGAHPLFPYLRIISFFSNFALRPFFPHTSHTR